MEPNPDKNTMMAAVRQGSFLWRAGLGFSHTVPKPRLTKPSHVLLKVLAAAINPLDYKLPKPFGGLVYGVDVCGEVVEVGKDGTERFKVGDLVFGLSNVSGSMAEYCVAYVNEIAHVPDWLTPIQAAALPVTYLTAVTGWKRVGLLHYDNTAATGLQLDDTVPAPESMIVIGASGGCGIAASQLARGWGVKRIVGICSVKNASFVKEVGGFTETLDYNDQDAMKEFVNSNEGKIDHVYDSVSSGHPGEDYNEWGLKLLKKDASSYVALNGGFRSFFDFLLLGGTGFRDPRQTMHLTLGVTPADLEMVLELLKKSNLKPATSVMKFSKENCEAGIEKLRSKRTTGKIVFDMIEGND